MQSNSPAHLFRGCSLCDIELSCVVQSRTSVIESDLTDINEEDRVLKTTISMKQNISTTTDYILHNDRTGKSTPI